MTEGVDAGPIAVTGAGGHLGANLVRRLLANGFRVEAIDRRRSAALDGLDVGFQQIDVRDRAALTAVYRGVEAVVHLAAKISVAGDPDGSVWSTNVEGAEASAAAALDAGVSRYVHVSSIHALSAGAAGLRIDESTPAPDDQAPVYDRSKAAGERAVLRLVEQGLNAVVLRPTGIIGPHDYEPSRMGRLIESIRRGRLRMVTAGRFDWVDGRDVSLAICSALDNGEPGETFLVPGTYASFSELGSLVAACAGSEARIREIPLGLVRPLGPISTRIAQRRPTLALPTTEAVKIVRESKPVNGERAAKTLGHRPRSLAESIEDIVAWHDGR